MSNDPTKRVPPHAVCPHCKADPLIFDIIDAQVPGQDQVILRQMLCANCHAPIAMFMLVQQGPRIAIPGQGVPS